MSPMTSALISYWQRLPAESPAIRRLNLAALRDEVRQGHRPPEALVTAILGDVDDEIVHAATRAYLEACATLPSAHRVAATDAAVEWVRRGLALNRGAVFAGLLATGDTVVHERLAALRLSLSTEEVAVTCRQLPPAPAKSIVAFLHEWVELIEGAEDPALSRQHDLLAGVLDRCGPSAVQLVAA
jgi:hypothetical protein